MPTDLARNAAKDDLSAEAVNRIFAVPVGKAGNVANGADARAVFKVTAATVPPLRHHDAGGAERREPAPRPASATT